MIPIAYLKAAVLFAAKDDPRYYLNGVRITPDAIYATNGHKAIRMMHTSSVPAPITVPTESVQAAIKAAAKVKAKEISIGLAQISPHVAGVLLGDAVYPIIAGGYSDIDAMLARPDTKGYTGAPKLCCDWQYMLDCQDASQLVAKYLGVGSHYCAYDLESSNVYPNHALREVLSMRVMRVNMTAASFDD